MQINISISIDDRIVSFFRNIARRWVLIGTALIAGTATAIAASDPGDFQNGTAIDATAVNARFKALFNAVNALEDGIQWVSRQGGAISHTTGRVGIGTEAPKATLHVVGQTILGAADAPQGKLSILQDANNAASAAIYISATSGANCRMWVQPKGSACSASGEPAQTIVTGGTMLLCGYCD